MGRLIKGFWDCNHCGKIGIGGSQQVCPNCGKARDANTKFYLDPNKSRYVPRSQAVQINRNPDWVCDYCNRLNSDNDTHCASCGSPRTSENLDYFENHAQKESTHESSHEDTGKSSINFEDIPSFSHDSGDTQPYFDKRKDEVRFMHMVKDEDDFADTDEDYSYPLDRIVSDSQHHYDSSATTQDDYNHDSRHTSFEFSKLLRIALIVIVPILVIAGLIYLFIPKEQELTVQSFSWKRSIEIERFQTVNESAWVVPSGGRVLYTNWEFYAYEDVLDHYETRTREVAKERLVGYEEYVTGYRDLGNGYFEEITSERPVYETYYETEYYEEPVYRSEPVYQIKYYYEIDKWLYERTVSTSGNDKDPYWGETNLYSDERISYESEQYTVICVDEKDKTHTINLSYDDWGSLNIGQTAKLKVSFGNGKIVE